MRKYNLKKRFKRARARSKAMARRRKKYSRNYISPMKIGVACVQANALLLRPVRTVAICGGAGAMLLDEAIAQGADAFVTGEMRYHEFFGHEQQLQIAVIGHYESEQYTNEIFKSILEELFPGIRCEKTNVNTNPIIYL